MVAHDPTPSRAEGGAKPWASRSRANAFAQGVEAVGYPKGPAWAPARADPDLARLRQHLAGGPGASAPGGAGGVHRPFAGGGVTAGSTPLGPAGVTGRGPSLRGVGFHLGLVLVALRVLTALLTPGLAGRWLVLPASLLLAAYGVLTGAGLPVQRAWLGALLLLMTLGLGRAGVPGEASRWRPS